MHAPPATEGWGSITLILILSLNPNPNPNPLAKRKPLASPTHYASPAASLASLQPKTSLTRALWNSSPEPNPAPESEPELELEPETLNPRP